MMMIVNCHPLRTLAILVGTAVLAAAGGCTLGPDFHSPAPPTITAYTSAPLPAQTVAAPGTGGAAQSFQVQEEIPARWWELFKNSPLDQLIRKALQENPTLDAAQSTLRQARENLRARSGSVDYPRIDANLSGARQRVSGAVSGQAGAGGSEYSLYNASVNVSYLLDLFGSGRRELEALQAQVDYQRYQLEASYLTLTANIVTAAVQEASLREQLQSIREIIALQEQQLTLVERQVQLGGAARADLLAQRAQLAQTRAELPPLEKELARTRNLLAVYAGSFPSGANLPEFDLQGFQLPQDLPLSIPSNLVRQRPDILAAEALLHAAGARVGVATANLYPQLTLSASLGSQSNQLQDLFSAGTSVWSLGAGLLQPVFHGGELSAERRAAVAAFDQASAGYRATVLQAFQNVADVLQTLEADARTLRAQVDADVAAQSSLDITQQQFKFGAVNSLALLNAQRQLQQSHIRLVQASAARFADTAALFQALGGGWWNRNSDDTRPKKVSLNTGHTETPAGLNGGQ
jgi:NodT family efflux transporter outer membrane factor (OMF) lipoprotein